MPKIATLQYIPEKSHMFRISDGIKCGSCFSYFDHFVIFWDDGTILKTIELSYYNFKTI